MNRFPLAVAPLLLFFLCAQIPYEYFDITEITPPGISNAQPTPFTGSIPKRLELDNQTQTAGNLKLSEPFAPPVGVYKRMTVFSDISCRNQVCQIHPDDTDCRTIHPKPAPPSEFSMHRSALVYLELSQTPVALPSDSPEMRILSLDAQPLSPKLSQHPIITLSQCRNQNYQISASIPGVYKIEYETASHADAAIPKDASFFASSTPSVPSLSPAVLSEIDALVAHIPELQTIKNTQPSLPSLIQFFQNFTSEPLASQPDSKLASSKALYQAILAEKKGVCRHRAFLFMLIAQAWGYPVRIAANEIHAFVEIQQNNRWYPVEMGGMADSLTIEPTNTELPATVQNQFSFAAPQKNRPSNGMRQLYDAPSVPPNYHNYPNMNPSGPSLIETHQTQGQSEVVVQFIPSVDFPVRLRRDLDAELSGQMLTSFGQPYANADVELEIFNESHQKNIVLRTHTDFRGYFKLRLRLPPDWPVGQTNYRWRAIK